MALPFQGEIGEKATTMITELIRDNRRIIDRIPQGEIDRIVGLVRKYKVTQQSVSGIQINHEVNNSLITCLFHYFNDILD